mgnify:FL=1
MNYACMTTFGPEYYEKYGRESVATMAQHWPGRVVAYGEGKKPPGLPERVEYRDLFAQWEFAAYLKWTGNVPLLRGVLPNGSYNYHFNMHKFGRKVFAITDMHEPFFFLGADVHVLKPIPEAFLAGMLDGKFGAFLLRKGLHTESDFAGYNTEQSGWRTFAHNYLTLYTHGSVLALPVIDKQVTGFHDCWSLDYLLRELGFLKDCTNITGDVKGDDENGFHVWPKTPLAEYMVHLKGRIKKDPEKKARALEGSAA